MTNLNDRSIRAPTSGHRVVEQAPRMAGSEQWDDMRMLEVGRDLDLAVEAVGADGLRHSGGRTLITT